jgi:hypothetical protein
MVGRALPLKHYGVPEVAEFRDHTICRVRLLARWRLGGDAHEISGKADDPVRHVFGDTKGSVH